MFDGTNPHGVPLQPTSTNVLWEGGSEDLMSLATGGRLQTAAYRLTEDALHFEAGTLSKVAENIPLWVIVDVDMKQSLTQRVRSVGDLHFRIDSESQQYGQKAVAIRSVKDPERVRDLIVRQANHVRIQMNEYRHGQRLEEQQAGASSVNIGVVPDSEATDAGQPAIGAGASSGDEMIAQLERLASLHQAGALSDEEFASAKAKLLG